ncbi:MAG: glycine--tRNA ligase subunit beta [Deltaproteobacteria bacterium]|nr:glycine--tRNA ligase subunit beta [Deltaproteobacteria bacterium]
MGCELLLEIGTEEIPARFLPPVMQEMADILRKRLDQARVQVGEITTYATPRRLALVAKDLAAGQAATVQEIIGPPKAIAFDETGSPTPAALGFAKAQGMPVSDLVEVDTPRGVYLAVSKSAAGRAAVEILPEILPEFIMGLSFPKSMRWGALHNAFARPIHWILALLDGKVVPFSLADVTSGAVTYGHRFLAPQDITVQDAASYLTALQKAHVLVDPVTRRMHLEQELARAAAEVDGEVVPNPGLLEENTFLVEYPSVVVGSFDQKFLALPDEVLITSMREHQRYFSLRGKDGKLLAHFIAVNNTLTRNPDVVRQGHERVLRARLSDAMYFYQVDSKVPLENRVDALKGVMFHSSLGTSYEKMERFRKLAIGLAKKLAPELAFAVDRAATLAKADITTEMVGEFPSLQGVMGEKYSLLTGEDPEVATALFSHYLPRHADDVLPTDLIGSLIGIADRLDTICGFFGVGLKPSGTADQYGLRRHALAIIRILRAQQLHLDLPELVSQALELLEPKLSRTVEETSIEVWDFLQTRLQHLLQAEGFGQETVAAVLAAGGGDVVDAMDKVTALEEIRQSPDFPALAVAFKRVINISRGAEAGEVDKLLLEYPEERALLEAATVMEEQVAAALEKRDYSTACKALANLKGPVDAFFDKVLVMAEDERVRRNRLSLLARISATFLQIADFSKITTQ